MRTEAIRAGVSLRNAGPNPDANGVADETLRELYRQKEANEAAARERILNTEPYRSKL